MGVLEYLTSNELISYPFKARRAIADGNNHPIADNWFLDILFTSFDDSIRGVYISKIKKTSLAGLEIAFSNLESEELLGTALIPPDKVVNHYKNSGESFVGLAFELFAVKIILGAGLIAKQDFEQVYTSSEASLASSAVTLNSPRLKTLTFESISFDPKVSTSPTTEVLMVYNYPEVPTVKANHNTDAVQVGQNSVDLLVARGAGAGLYDPCTKPGEIEDLYSLNLVTPNEEGALFLNPSSCYTANVLTSNAETLYGDLLTKYRTFEIYTSPTTTSTFDAVNVGHAITFENFCKPKCPPENLGAYAHYLNRVADGAKELDTLITRSVETRGKGSSFLKLFTAAAFCVTGDAVFARCDDPADPLTYIGCGEHFLKNYHEGRTLQLYYDNITVRNYKIVEVVDSYRVRLDSTPPPPADPSGLLSFRVLDNGVISNLNCATLSYNKNAENFLKIYHQISYSTNEAYTPDGVYGTNLAIVVAIYNPSARVVPVRAVFNPSPALRQISQFKIAKADSINMSGTSEVLLNCREYVFISTVFAITCETDGGFLDVSVFEKVSDAWLMVGEIFSLPEIVGGACPGTATGGIERYVVTQQNSSLFHEQIAFPDPVASISDFYGNTPAWLLANFDQPSNILTLSASATASEATSQRYNAYFKTSAAGTAIWQLLIDYIAAPEILVPQSGRFSPVNPLILSKSSVYTAENPIIQVSATNMTLFTESPDFNAASFKYTVSPSILPDGLSFSETTGNLTGQLPSSILPGSVFELTFNAINPSGSASNPQTVTFAVAVEAEPIISLVSPPANEIYLTNNLDLHTLATPLVAFTAINLPIFGYDLQGTLPPGLSFDRSTGKVTGRVTASTPGSTQLFVTADNVYGTSNTVSFTISYQVHAKPQFTAPVEGLVLELEVDNTTTSAAPLITAASLQAYGGTDNFAPGLTDATRNYYMAAGLPAGLQLERYTGKIYGKLADSALPTNSLGSSFTLTYPIRLGVYNPVGNDTRSITLVFYSEGVPVINNILPNTTLNVTRGYAYTEKTPLFKVTALNSPTNFIAVGLPTGLVCSSSGYITGSVGLDVAAGTYIVSITASNNLGTSVVETLNLSVPLSLITPAPNSRFALQVDAPTSTLAQVVASPTLAGDAVSLSVTNLPPGIVYSNGALAGSPTSIGKYSVTINATSANSGSASIVIRVEVLPVSYSVSGTVLDASLDPVADIVITDGRDKQAVTNAAGEYTLTGLSSGGYNIVASNNIYSVIPTFQKVQIVSSNQVGINFAVRLDTRLISGYVLAPSEEGVQGVTITDGEEITTTDSYGFYELYVYGSGAKTISPSSEFFSFAPPQIVVPAGTVDVVNSTLLAVPSRKASKPTINSVTSEDKKLIVLFSPPSDDGGRAITNYEYSTDLGEHWTAFVPEQTTSPLEITKHVTADGIFDLVNGTTYNITIRAVNPSGGGSESLIVKAIPGTVPGSPTITSYATVGTSATIFFSAPVETGGVDITSYKYSIDGGTTFIATDYASSPILIPSLVLEQSYSVALKAVNIFGESAASAVYTVVLAVSPDPPTISDITAGDSKLTVAFTLPTDTGSADLYNVGYSINGGATYNYNATPSLTSPLEITGLTNGTSYYVALQVVNVAGKFSVGSNVLIGTPMGLPLAPTGLELTSGDTQLTAYFTQPINGVLLVTNYKYQLDDGAWLPITPTKTGSPVVITGLTNGTEYSVKLKAVSAAGDGEASLAALGTPAALAAAPTITSVTPGNAQLSVLFTKSPFLGGLPLQNYSYSIDSGRTYAVATVTDLSPTTGSFDITGLTNGTAYSVLLKARTAVGLGKPSNSLSGTPRTVPTAPIDLIATAGNKSAAVQFTAPLSSGGAAITNYQYQLNSDAWVSRNPASNSTSFNIPSLTNGKFYYLKLRAVNIAGAGSESASVSFVPAAPPTAPKIAKVYSKRNKLQLIFVAPVDNGGSIITGYEYSLNGGQTYQPAGEPNVGALPDDSTEAPYLIIDGLVNGTTYFVSLRALNYAGTGPASNTVQAVPVGPPPAPTILSIGSTPTGARVRFAPPSSNGGAAITNYGHLTTPAGGVAKFTTLSPASTAIIMDITGLVAGQVTSVKICAINSYGAGDFSQEVSVTPGAPLSPTITSLVSGDRKLTVNFTQPSSSGGAAITNYEYSIDSGVSYIPVNSLVSPFEITGLTNYTSYSVQMRAISSAGNSAASNSVTGTPTNLPSAPTINKIVTVNNVPSVHFTVPSNDGGSAIIGYKYSLDGVTFTATNSVDNPFDLPGLEIGKTYGVSLKATNANGDSPASATFTIIAGAPAAPVIDFISATSSSVQISFTLPEDGGSPLLNHEYSLDGANTWAPLNPPSTQSPLILTTALRANTRHSIRIRAVNAVGAGTPSSPAGVGRGLGSIPEITRVVPEDSTLTLNILPPGNHVQPIVDYKYNVYTNTDTGVYIPFNVAAFPVTSLTIPI
jgi:hypothetical protein